MKMAKKNTPSTDECPNCGYDERIKHWGKYRKCPMCMCVWEVEEAPKETTKTKGD